MNLEKITRIGCIALGLLGVIFLAIVFVSGDDSIKMDAASGNFASITPIIILSQLILLIAVIVTLIFSLRGIAKDKAKMKNALKSAGLFLAVVVVAFVLSNGVETPMRDGEVLSAMGSRLVGTGLRVFYILSIIAVGTSLPEILVTIASIKKKEFSIAIGNIVGSNILNMLGVLGIPALFSTFDISSDDLNYQMIFLFLSSLLIFIPFIIDKFRKTISVVYFALYIFTLYYFGVNA